MSDADTINLNNLMSAVRDDAMELADTADWDDDRVNAMLGNMLRLERILMTVLQEQAVSVEIVGAPMRPLTQTTPSMN